MRYINTLTETSYKSQNKVDLAHEMYSTSWVRSDCKNVYDWCKGASFRLFQVHNIILEYDDGDLESFVDALIQHNIIKEIH
tara:strand:+ start:432 stop:674 length:243 start_codon:yes stop_codon:yes gene_type:complete